SALPASIGSRRVHGRSWRRWRRPLPTALPTRRSSWRMVTFAARRSRATSKASSSTCNTDFANDVPARRQRSRTPWSSAPLGFPALVDVLVLLLFDRRSLWRLRERRRRQLGDEVAFGQLRN